MKIELTRENFDKWIKDATMLSAVDASWDPDHNFWKNVIYTHPKHEGLWKVTYKNDEPYDESNDLKIAVIVIRKVVKKCKMIEETWFEEV